MVGIMIRPGAYPAKLSLLRLREQMLGRESLL